MNPPTLEQIDATVSLYLKDYKRKYKGKLYWTDRAERLLRNQARQTYLSSVSNSKGTGGFSEVISILTSRITNSLRDALEQTELEEFDILLYENSGKLRAKVVGIEEHGSIFHINNENLIVEDCKFRTNTRQNEESVANEQDRNEESDLELDIEVQVSSHFSQDYDVAIIYLFCLSLLWIFMPYFVFKLLSSVAVSLLFWHYLDYLRFLAPLIMKFFRYLLSLAPHIFSKEGVVLYSLLTIIFKLSRNCCTKGSVSTDQKTHRVQTAETSNQSLRSIANVTQGNMLIICPETEKESASNLKTKTTNQFEGISIFNPSEVDLIIGQLLVCKSDMVIVVLFPECYSQSQLEFIQNILFKKIPDGHQKQTKTSMFLISKNHYDSYITSVFGKN